MDYIITPKAHTNSLQELLNKWLEHHDIRLIYFYSLLSVFLYLIWDKSLFSGMGSVCWCVLTVILWLAHSQIHLWSLPKCCPSWNERCTSSSVQTTKGSNESELHCNIWPLEALLTALPLKWTCTNQNIVFYVTICFPLMKNLAKYDVFLN